jgi:signal transduction histidine kinase
MPPTYGGAAARDPSREDPDLTERFSDRARALFYARLAFLGIGLAVLAVPSWSSYLGTTSSTAFIIYFAVIGYSVANFLLIDHPRFGRPLTFLTLIFDLTALASMIMPSGGLKSPLMAAHVLFTIFLVLLFPRIWSMVPPLLMLPIVARLDLIFQEGAIVAQGLFLVVWYTTLALIAAYVLLYLSTRDEKRSRQLKMLSKAHEVAIITEERLRLAREIHDGLGGSLSTLIIQTEFIQRMAKDPHLKGEITDLKTQAEEAIEELRRSLTMMRRDFDLHKALEDYGMRFQERSRVWCSVKVRGRIRRLPSEMQLAVFRILQECLTNIQKHANAKNAEVRLKYDGDMVSLIVRDDGQGFDATSIKRGHYGLTNITERAKKFRGTIDVQSAPGDGTTIHVTLVIPAEGSHVAFLPDMVEA